MPYFLFSYKPNKQSSSDIISNLFSDVSQYFLGGQMWALNGPQRSAGAGFKS